jgi:predicted flap endonuclease-1-like 5' DNA nuclease
LVWLLSRRPPDFASAADGWLRASHPHSRFFAVQTRSTTDRYRWFNGRRQDFDHASPMELNVSTAREARATRVNDVRRGTRELLARIRQERIARADKTVPVVVKQHRCEEPAPAAGLMPDPLITKLSEQLFGGESTDAASTAAVSQPQHVVGESIREASAPGRVTRHYDSARLGISPVNKEDSTLRLDLSVSRPSRDAAAQQRFAKLAGLQAFEPVRRRETDTTPSGNASPQPSVQGGFEASLPGIETIPTLGPGLIWRLSQAGICTMADLAACDADSIRTKLGQLGRLVKVEDWIAHARAVVADPASTSASPHG